MAYPESLAYADLDPEDFSDPDYALVYRTICDLADKGEQVDATSVMVRLSERMDTDKLLDIARAGLSLPSAVERMAQSVREAAVKRRLSDAAWKIVSAVNQVDDVCEALAEAERLLTEAVGDHLSRRGMWAIEDVMVESVELVLDRATRKRGITGVPTGSVPLDMMTGGWQPSELVVVAARPSMGKTAWMLHSAIHATKAGVAVIFSLEMSKEQLGERLLSSVGRVSMQSLRLGDLTDEEIQRISAASAALSPLLMFVDDSAGVTASYIRGQLRRLRRKFPDKPIVAYVDYLQIIEQRGRSQAEEYGAIAAALKNTAKELGITVVALCQLNRQCELRQNKRPTLSDVRGSGEIEQTADIVIGLYRDAYYDPDTPDKNICELIVLKHRNGPTGTVKMYFDEERQIFGDLARER